MQQNTFSADDSADARPFELLPPDRTDGGGIPKQRMGRPEFPIDLMRLEALCQVHATDEEIAAHFGCSVKTIQRRKQSDEDFASVFTKGKADGKISLRRAQWQEALKGNGGMLIWLGKQVLGQRDNIEVTRKMDADQLREMLDGLSDEELMDLVKQSGLEADAPEPKADEEEEN
jgi:hypothetical protein